MYTCRAGGSPFDFLGPKVRPAKAASGTESSTSFWPRLSNTGFGPTNFLNFVTNSVTLSVDPETVHVKTPSLAAK